MISSVIMSDKTRLRHNNGDEVFKSGPNKICGRQPFKNLKRYSLLYPFKSFKGCCPQFTLSTIEYFVPMETIMCQKIFKNIKLDHIISNKES